MADNSIGDYYTLPVIASFEGIDQQVNKSLGSKLKPFGKKAGKEFGDGFSGGVADGMKAAEKAIEQSTRNIEKLRDKAANATDAARLAEEKYQEAVSKGVTGSRLTAASNAREKALRAEKAATADLRRETEKLERAQKDLADGAGAEEGGESAGSSFLDGFSGGIAALATKAGPIGAAITAAAGVALAGGAIIGTQVMAGMEREVAFDKIAAQLGLNDTEMARFGDVAGRTYASNFGESMGDVGDALAAVTSTLGRTTPTAVLEDMTQKALTFRDVFGTDVAESIAFAQNLVANGLAPDAESAFDAMVTAYQRVPAAMRDELPDILSEYSTFTDSLGFSLEEAFGLIVKNAPKGTIAIDKVGDALKEFTLLATDIGAKPVQDALSSMGLDGGVVANNLLAGGDTAAQQFDEIIDGLLRIPDAGQQAAAAIALFGTPLEDLDKAKIPEFLSGLNDADQAMQGFAGSAGNMVQAAGDNAAGTVESAKRSVELAVGGMQDSLAAAFGPAIEQLATFITDHQAEITGFFSGLGEASAIAGEAILIFVAESTGALADIVNAVGDSYGAVMTAAAGFADLVGDDDRAAEFREQAQAGYGLADSLYAMEEGARSAAGAMSDAADNFGSTKEQAGLVAQNVERISGLMAGLPGGKQIDISAIVTYKDQNGLVIPPEQLRAPRREVAVPGESFNRPGRAYGGPITGPGGPKSDIIPIWASNGEHMLPADEVDMLGGQGGVYQLRSLIRAGAFRKYAAGGAIGLDALYNKAEELIGTPYSMAKRDDCSGTIAQLVNAALGLPEKGDLMSTMTASKWLTAKGAILGEGPSGTFRIGWKNGGPGGGHMAATLPDGMNVEMGGANGGYTLGGDAAGWNDPSFTDHAYFPIEALYPDGAPVGGGSYSIYDRATGGSGYGTGSSGSGVSTAGYGPNGEAGTYTVDPAEVSDAEGRVREADARVREAEAKQRELDADAKESERIAAENDVAKAREDARKARTELDEARRGKFEETDTTSSGEKLGGKGGLDQFGELGKIAGSFLTETFGIDGSWLPDLSSLMPVQMAESFLDFLLPTVLGAPGDAATQTSNTAFGMPDVAAPALPPPGVHTGTGNPGPGNAGTSLVIDQSVHGNVGSSPEELFRRRDAGLARALTRVPVGN